MGTRWNNEEEKLLITQFFKYSEESSLIVELPNTDKWKVIAEKMPGRTEGAVKARLKHILCDFNSRSLLQGLSQDLCK